MGFEVHNSRTDECILHFGFDVQLRKRTFFKMVIIFERREHVRARRCAGPPLAYDARHYLGDALAHVLFGAAKVPVGANQPEPYGVHAASQNAHDNRTKVHSLPRLPSLLFGRRFRFVRMVPTRRKDSPECGFIRPKSHLRKSCDG
jgi:hypothetical protein